MIRLKGLGSISLVLLALFAFQDVDAQFRNRVKSRMERNKSISRYHGENVGGKFRPYQFVGIGINALNYYGDLAPVNKAASTDVSFTRPGGGLVFGYRFHPMYALRINFNYGRLIGDDFTSDPNNEDDRPRYMRNLSFRNDIKELNIGLNVFLIPEAVGPNQREPINVYLFAGVGVFHHSPYGKVPTHDFQSTSQEPMAEAGQWVKLRDLGTEGQFLEGVDAPEPYKSIEFNIPVMIGAQIRIPGTPLNAQFESGIRLLFTDYLDDVSGQYVDLNLFDSQLARVMSDRSSEPIAVMNGSEGRDVSTVNPHQFSDGSVRNISTFIGSGISGSVRGNPDNTDIYWLTQIRLTYILPSSAGRSTAKFR